MMTFVSCGVHVGSIAAALVVGIIGSSQVPQNIFYYVGIFVLVFCIFWFVFVFDRPEKDPFIKDQEAELLKSQISHKPKIRNIPWLKMALSSPLWAIISGDVAHSWCFFLMSTNFSIYIRNVLGYDLQQNGFLSALPWFVLLVCTLIVGPLCDHQIKIGMFSISTARKLYTVIGNIPSAILLLGVSYVKSNWSVLLLFNLAMAFKCGIYTGLRTNILDLAPNFSGVVMAVVNMFGAFTAVIIPLLIAGLVQHDRVEDWRIIFWITFVLMCLLTSIYAIFASGKVQSWNDIENPSENVE